MQIPERSDLPEDAANWSDLDLSLPTLPEGDEQSRPFTRNEMSEYLRAEISSPTRVGTPDATALVGETKYWLWQVEQDGVLYFLVASVSSNNPGALVVAEANGLSPAQFLLAVHYDEVYWP